MRIALLCAGAYVRLRHKLEAFAMFDITYLVLGLGFFALMVLYARWAGNA